MSDKKGFEDRLKSARDEYNEDYNPKPAETNNISGAETGYEFLAYVISGGLLGYLCDRFIGTAPWGIMAGLVLGLVAGVFRANDRMKKQATKLAEKSRK